MNLSTSYTGKYRMQGAALFAISIPSPWKKEIQKSLRRDSVMSSSVACIYSGLYEELNFFLRCEVFSAFPLSLVTPDHSPPDTTTDSANFIARKVSQRPKGISSVPHKNRVPRVALERIFFVHGEKNVGRKLVNFFEHLLVLCKKKRLGCVYKQIRMRLTILTQRSHAFQMTSVQTRSSCKNCDDKLLERYWTLYLGGVGNQWKGKGNNLQPE